jgi:GABA permease
MRNPLKDEETAFRFVLGTIVYLALIVFASWLATWFGVVVFVVISVVAVALLRGGTKPLPVTQHVDRAPVEDTLRILVVANETLEGQRLHEEIVRMADGAAEDVLVVCPALNSQLRTWVSDEDGARDAAQLRLDSTLDSLRAAGVNVRGEIGDGDPLQALEDALRSFAADQIVISTHAEGRSNWLERGVVEAARARFDVPVTHVVGDGSGYLPATLET